MQKSIVKLQFGSHVYGTNVAGSDTDYRSIHIPDSMDILLQRVQATMNLGTKLDPTKPNSPEDIDHTSYSLQKYLELLLTGHVDSLAMFFTPDPWLVESSPEWEDLQRRKEHWLYSGIDGIKGFCLGKINKYGIFGGRIEVAETAMNFFAKMIDSHGPQTKLEDIWGEIESMVGGQSSSYVQIVEGGQSNKEEVGQKMLDICDKKTQSQSSLKSARSTFKGLHESYLKRAAQAESGEGVDWKELMHVVRVCHEAQELLVDHRITYPRPEAELLLQIRNGQLSYKHVAGLIDEGIQRIQECQGRSTLPERPNQDMAERFVADVYRAQVLSGLT